MSKSGAILLMILLVRTLDATGAGALEDTVYQAYPAGFGGASNAVEIVQQVIGPDGRVIFDAAGNRLLVWATPAQHAQLAPIVRELNVPPRNVRIDVEFKTRTRNQDRSASVGAGGSVSAGGADLGVSARVRDDASRGHSVTRQTLVVTSGRQASLFVGETVPELDWLMAYAVRGGYVSGPLAWQKVGSCLVVEPVVIGDGPSVRVRVTPELSGTVDGRPSRIRFASAGTEVVVNDGVAISLGGLDQNSDVLSRFLIGAAKSGSRYALEITLTPHIDGRAGR